MGTSDQAQPRGTLKIVWEGLKLAYSNSALLYPILLLSFLSSSLFFLLGYLCAPLFLDLAMKSILVGNTDPESPEYFLLTVVLKDLKELGPIEVVVLVISFIANSLVATATVHVLSTAYSSNTPSSKLIKEVVFARLNWSLIRRSMITQLYVAFFKAVLTVGVLSFYYSSSSLSLSHSHSHSFMVISALGVIVAVMEACLLLYLSVVLNTGVVVSVVEEGSCYGSEAITKAGKLIRGRSEQAFLIALVELVVGVVLYAGYNLVMAHAPSINMVQLALGFGQVALGVVNNLLIWSVLTVYYYECSDGHGEGIATEGAGFEYSPVPPRV